MRALYESYKAFNKIWVIMNKLTGEGEKMQTIQVDSIEVENFIKLQYGQDSDSLLNDFMTFVKTEMTAHEIKKGFDEVELFESGKKPLKRVEDVMARLKSGD
jgi:hypothetical protein